MKEKNIFGSYELRGELGRGAMAKVWRAWDPSLEREVAIKEPLFDQRLSVEILEELNARFVKEGKAAARLNHPGIVTIYAADVYDGKSAIVMELIEGITLGELLEKGPMAPSTVLDVLDQLLDAVGYAHSQGVIHRDIKPDNIFITNDGRVKLADFGIAHIDDSSMTKKTQVGTVLGTPGYMAPEQATGAVVDNRTDLFAIGTVAYEMLTGSNPFGSGDSTTLLYRIVHEPVPDLPSVAAEDLPTDIRPAILAALSKHPSDRPQDAASFKAMLHGADAPSRGVRPAASPTLVEEATKAKNANKWLPYVLVGGVGIIVICAMFFFATNSGGGGVVSGQPTQAVSETSKDEAEVEETESSEEPAEEAKKEISIDMTQINDAIAATTSANNVSVGIIDLSTDKTFTTSNAQVPFEASGFYLPIVNVALSSGIGIEGDASNVLRTMDNQSANNLVAQLGGFGELNRKIYDSGLTGTSYNRAFGDTKSSAQNLTTASDAVQALKTAYQSGSYVNMQSGLADIGIQLPPNVTINAHRGSGVKTAVNTFCIMSAPNSGAVYAVAILTTNMGGSAEEAKNAAAPLISNLLSNINGQVELSFA